MAKLICELKGVRGRSMKLYDTKCVIATQVTVGSVITGNATDGEKTIFLSDVTGVQFKPSGLAIGYLQLETPAMQMNHGNDNFFGENTFTYENEKNGITNELMEAVYNFLVDRLEEIKYGVPVIQEIPDFEAMKVYNEYNGAAEFRESDGLQEEVPAGEKCQLCGEYVDHLTYCKVKDDYGTRFRYICDACIVKYKAKPQK